MNARKNRLQIMRRSISLFLALTTSLVVGCFPVVRVDSTVKGVRLGSKSNVVERVVAHGFQWGIAALITPEGPATTYYGNERKFYLERAEKNGMKSTRIQCLEPTTIHRLPRYNFWPVPGTNLWLMTDIAAAKTSPSQMTHPEQFFVTVRVLDARRIHYQTQFTALPTRIFYYPDFRFDAEGTHVIYLTPQGYVSLNFADGQTKPIAEPPGAPALPVKELDAGYRWPLKPD